MQGATPRGAHYAPSMEGCGAVGGSMLLNGFVSMELARVDARRFDGVHAGIGDTLGC